MGSSSVAMLYCLQRSINSNEHQRLMNHREGSTLKKHRWIKASMCLLFALFSLSSCGPGEISHRIRIDWSPDGTKAILFASDGLRIADAKGGLSEILLPLPSETGEPQIAVWMPDGEHFIGVTRERVRDWDKLKQLIPSAEQKRIAYAAQRCERFVSSGKCLRTLSKDDRSEWEKTIHGLSESDVDVFLAQKQQKTLDRWMDQPPESSVLATTVISCLCIYRVINSKVEAGPTIYRSRQHIERIAVSPDGQSVAGTESRHSFQCEPSLFILPFKFDGKPMTVPPTVAEQIDWCPDNKSVAFIKKNGTVGTLQVATVFGSNGELLKKPKIKSIASIPGFDRDSGLQCTNDGMVILSCSDVPFDMPSHKQKLYRISLATGTLERLVPDKYSIDDSCEYFKVSDNGRNIAVLKADGTVAVLDSVNGTTVGVQISPFAEWQYIDSAFLPDWRNNDQLCFCAPTTDTAKSRGAAVKLFSLSDQTTIDLSSGWPTKAAEFLARTADD